MDISEISQILCKKLGHPGRMIAGSKLSYHTKNPNNFVLFNANIITKDNGKIWFGDIDITKDGPILKEIAKDIDAVLYILREMDARFSKEGDPIQELMSRAIWHTEKPDYLPALWKNKV